MFNKFKLYSLLFSKILKLFKLTTQYVTGESPYQFWKIWGFLLKSIELADIFHNLSFSPSIRAIDKQQIS